jgi:hypothetical protein
MKRYFAILSVLLCLVSVSVAAQLPATTSSATGPYEYLWYEAENMRGFSTNGLNEPVLNPSYMFLPKEKAPGWGINGPGVSAEWSQGGESEWNSAAASADETKASIYQDIEVPKAGDFRFFVRYADWAGKNENFTVRISQNNREVFKHEFGATDIIDPHDEVSMYWGWAFAWDEATAKLDKGPARVTLDIEKATAARRHVDCWVLSNDPAYIPDGRRKPPFAAAQLLERPGTFTSLLPVGDKFSAPPEWKPRPIAGRDFLMPWNIAKEFWAMYDKPEKERPLYPFSAEPIDEFVKSYAGKTDVPIFASKLVVPVIYINDLPIFLKEGSPFLRYLRQTHSPFAVLINYGSAGFTETDGPAAWKLLNGELKDQFLGWISGESIGFVWPPNPANPLTLTPAMPRRQMLESLGKFYSSSIDKKWAAMFHTKTGPQWDKMIVALSTSSTSMDHALGELGSRLIGMETAAVQPGTGMRIAFTRGAARQFGGSFLYYHAANFGDSALSFSKQQNFAGPDFFYHSRYGQTFGTSLSWYRKSYYLYYMAGASAIYNEQGFDQFFKPGPGEHPFQLNPSGRITDEFVKFVEKHPDRGTPFTPIAFLLDPAHGFEMTDYPQWPFGVSQIDRGDRALRELFGAAYFPMPVNEGEPATSDRQAFVSAKFGDIFDVLVTSDTHAEAINGYRALVVGGRVELNPQWVKRLIDYARSGGTVVLNAAQAKGLSTELTGLKFSGATAEANNAKCSMPGDDTVDLRGQVFRYEKVIPEANVQVLIQSPTGEPLVTSNPIGKGRVIIDAVPDMLGLDERMTPFSAHLLSHLFTNATPIQVSGDVEYLVNRAAKGWIVTLFNNRGVYKPQQGLAEVKRSEVADVSIALSGAEISTAREWTDDNPLAVKHVNGRGQVELRIAAGGIRIVELVVKNGQ